MTWEQAMIAYLTGAVATFCLYMAYGLRRFHDEMAELTNKPAKPLRDSVSLVMFWPHGLFVLVLRMALNRIRPKNSE